MHKWFSVGCGILWLSWCLMEFCLGGEKRHPLCPQMTLQAVSDASFTLFVLLTTSSFMRLRDFCDTLTWTKCREHRMCNLQLILSLWERRDQAIGLLWPREVNGATSQTAGWKETQTEKRNIWRLTQKNQRQPLS